MIELYPDVFRFALSLSKDRHHAEDLAQETMLRAMRKSHRDTGFRSLDASAQKRWLFRVTHNLWVDGIRVASTRSEAPIEESTIMLSSESSPARSSEIRETLNATINAMNLLPERQRHVIYLRTVEGFSVDEVADTLGLSRSSVKTNLSYARKKMRAWLSSQEKIESSST